MFSHVLDVNVSGSKWFLDKINNINITDEAVRLQTG
jgi:hypothetical protein